MFSPDVVNFREFYATALGESARALIAAELWRLWPDARGDAMLGIGYPIPYIEPYLAAAAPLAVCMPAAQGAVHWPPKRPGRVFLAEESQLPLADNSVNRVLLVHGVEHSEQLSWMMREIWRVLTPGGRVLALVPNRLSFWSRSPRSPLGYGRPFSMAQLRALMSGHEFTVTRSSSAVFIPPLRARPVWRMAKKLETLGRLLCPFLGAMLFIEAEKQVYAAIRQPVAARARRAPIPAATPAMSRR